MRIKSLEIHGFKSFADRTLLHFGDGITGVVGPNGCGKSNIVDALRWAMGEQSAKHLRGSDMEDVIFAGSESRGPLGMCEVTVTFKNDGTLLPPELRDMPEVSVGRRLFRDGTSEYLINKDPARLRDVTDLFLGTGIGTKSYSIIEQGRIGMVVTAKPDDLRALIEDAAGVSKYKARRKLAERRLEAAEQNLLRVADIVQELKKRLGSLERQAKKTARYREMKAEFRALDLWAMAHRHLELTALERFFSQNEEAAKDALSASESTLLADEDGLRTEALRLDKVELERREEAKRLSDIEQKLAVATKTVEHAARESESIERRMHEAMTEKESLTREAEVATQELSNLVETQERLTQTVAQEDESISLCEAALAAKNNAVAAVEGEVDAQKLARMAGATKLAQNESRVVGLDRQIADLAHRREKGAESAKVATDGLQDAVETSRSLRTELDKTRQLKLQLDDQRTHLEANLVEHDRVFAEQAKHLLDLRHSLSLKRSRLASIVEIHDNYEGLQDGVRSIMRRASENVDRATTVHGVVADVLSTDRRFEAAVEAVLQDRLQYVIVPDQDEGVHAIDYLRDKAEGRSTFVPLDLRMDHASWAPRRAQSARRSLAPVNRTEDQHADANQTSFAPFVRREAALDAGVACDGVASMMPTIVGDRIGEPGSKSTDEPVSQTATPKTISDRPPPPEIEEFAEALQKDLLSRPPQTDMLVSHLPFPMLAEEDEDAWPDMHAEGVIGKMVDLVSSKPTYDAVKRVLLGDVVVVENLDAARRLWRSNGHRKVLVTLSGEVLDPVGIISGGSNQGISTGLLAKKREISELTLDVEKLESDVASAELEHARLKERIGALRESIDDLRSDGHEEALCVARLEQELRATDERRARLTQDKERLERELVDLLQKQETSQGERAAALHNIAELQREIERLEATIQERSAALETMRNERAALSQTLFDVRTQAALLRERCDQARRNRERQEARMKEIASRLTRIESNLVEGQTALFALATERKTNERASEELSCAASALRASLETLSATLDADLAKLRAGEDDLRLRRAGLDSIREALQQATLGVREHQLARENLHAQVEERYQVAMSDAVFDHHLVQAQEVANLERRTELQRKIEAMGDINLTAVDEYNEVKERHDFLASQKTDLEAAIASLKSAIRKINRTSKERYLRTFELVNAKFQVVFPRLFNGGKASLVLSNEDEPLDSGVEMLAEPPGKKLQHVSLLSGGEKALTAVALIFSIFLVKPTPFCLLDEVDAPLDDANVGRYNDLVRDMSQISQFILITHNKRTMELPDRLFGVTMEDPGISKIVAVDMKEGERHLRLVS